MLACNSATRPVIVDEVLIPWLLLALAVVA
jgi:hypothetical protein